MAGPDSAATLIKDGSDSTFMVDVIEASRETPVIVDFWAPWCGPCRQLSPPLERAIQAAGGAVKLVKINIDDNPGVAGQLGVRSIPAVFAFVRGQPVDGFMGVIAESQIKMFIDRLSGGGDAEALAEDIDALLEQSKESLALGDIGGAAQGFAAILQIDPEHPGAIAGLARCYLMAGELDQARETLAMVPAEKANDPAVVALRAQLELAGKAAEPDALSLLKAKVDADPNDHQSRFELAEAQAAHGDFEGAIDHLLTIIERDRTWNEEAARLQLLKVFEAAGHGSEVTKSGRRRLSALLFS